MIDVRIVFFSVSVDALVSVGKHVLEERNADVSKARFVSFDSEQLVTVVCSLSTVMYFITAAKTSLCIFTF